VTIATDQWYGDASGPILAGQYASYIAFTLQMWQKGFRKTVRLPWR